MIDGDDARHLARSLRARRGQEIDVVDPNGFLLRVRLDSISAERVAGAVVSERPHRPEPDVRVTIAIAHLPAPALELVLSRCTEAGAHAFVVFHADRSIGRGEKLERWNTICREAAMLARRLIVPDVSFASSLDAVIDVAESPLMLDRDAPRRLEPGTRDATLVIGPEGGWTEREMALAEGMTASLGPRNLRADTAALVALAVVLANA